MSRLPRLHPDDIRAIAEAVAFRLRSAGTSPAGIGALVTGDQCDENGEIMYTDLTTEVAARNDGESSSPEQMASRLLSRSKQKPRRNVLPMRPARRSKAGQ